jgi:di/tricarboxylate transporter
MAELGWQAWVTLAVVAITVVVLVRDLIAPALAILFADIVLLVVGVITAEQAFRGFSNPAPITVAALFVVARAVEKTGALQPLVRNALGNGEGRWHLARLLVPTAFSSAILNNTPVVAMLAPQVADWAEKRGRSPSRYLMPLSFATILGGTLTLIGTSTNLVVAGLMIEADVEPLGLFELSRIGLPVAVLGLAIILVFSTRLLPGRPGARQQFTRKAREYVMHQRVDAGGPLDGVTVEEAGLRHLQGVFLAEVVRGDQVIAPAPPTTVLHGGDRLAFVGRVDLVRDLQQLRGLSFEEEKHASFFTDPGHTFFEAVVSPAGSLVGKTLREVEFRSAFQAAVVAIHRAGERVNQKLGDVRLREGDTLLLLSDDAFGSRWRDRSEFLLVSHLGGSPVPSTRQAYLVAGVVLAMIVAAGVGLLGILQAVLLAALLLIILGALTPAEARGAVELDTLIIIAASFGLGAAVEASGLADLIAGGIVGGFSSFGTIGVLLGITLATIALTELITNNAAAVLLFPIAMASAHAIGADPRPFLIALTVAASASFLTPIGYQTNTMVYGLGGYRFGDYARLGAPVTLAVILMILVFVPLFWPF